MAHGKKTGGRQKGVKNKATILNEAAVRERVEAAKDAGLTPLEFMLSVMRDETRSFQDRYAAARDAAPYQHPKLATVQHSGDSENPVEYVQRVELVTPSHVNGPDRDPSEAAAGIYGPS